MSLFIIYAISIIFLLLVIKNLKIFRARNIFKLNKKNFYSWMNLTKKERFELSMKESDSYFNKRKSLLAEIRNEYKNISKREKKSI